MSEPAPTRIVNRGSGHSYMLDGAPVPGVTTILSDGIPKGALVGWAARTVAEYVIDRLAVGRYTAEGEHVSEFYSADDLVRDLRAYNETRKSPERLGDGLSRVGLTKVLATVQYAQRDEAANRGTEVHKLAEQLARGDTIDAPEPLAGHVAAYVRFLDEWQPSNALLEGVIVNRRWRYMGRFDLIADLPYTPVPGAGGNPERWELVEAPSRALLDIKTGRSGPFSDVALQLAAYRNGETMLDPEHPGGEFAMPGVDWCGVIWVRADGYDVYRFEADDDAFRAFLYAKQVGEWLDWKEGPASRAKSDALAVPTQIEGAA